MFLKSRAWPQKKHAAGKNVEHRYEHELVYEYIRARTASNIQTLLHILTGLAYEHSHEWEVAPPVALRRKVSIIAREVTANAPLQHMA